MQVQIAQGIALDCERSGAGPPLLMIMGLAGTRHHWNEAFLAQLRGDFELITFDHRGIARSSPAQEPFELADLARDAAALLDALELDSAHVLGISMGSMVAQELALAHPELVRTLTLGCTYCGGPHSVPTSREVLARLAAGMSSGDYEVAARALWEVNVSAPVAADPEMWQRFLAAGREHRVPREVIVLQWQAIARHDTSARLGGLAAPPLAAPPLAIHGTADQMVDVANGRQTASLIPGCRLELMEGVGHLFFWEEPPRAAELVREHALVRA